MVNSLSGYLPAADATSGIREMYGVAPPVALLTGLVRELAW